MQQQVGIDGFLQRGLEGLDEAVRQIADEAHRVGQRDAAADLRQEQLARGGVERGKQLVGRITARLDQGIEQRRLARVGVADQRDGKGVGALALAALRGTLALDLFEPLLDALDRFGDHAAVQLDLGFARAAACAGAALLALQVAPATHEARAQVLQPRQFDLQLALVAARTLREDFKDEHGSVVDRHAERALEVALLRGAERLVEQDFGGAGLLGEQLDLVGLAAAHEQGWIGRAALAGDPRDRFEAGSLGQQAEFFEFRIEMRKAKIHPHQNGERGGILVLHQGIRAPGGRWSPPRERGRG